MFRESLGKLMKRELMADEQARERERERERER
jgi:hypothetical protein